MCWVEAGAIVYKYKLHARWVAMLLPWSPATHLKALYCEVYE